MRVVHINHVYSQISIIFKVYVFLRTGNLTLLCNCSLASEQVSSDIKNPIRENLQFRERLIDDNLVYVTAYYYYCCYYYYHHHYHYCGSSHRINQNQLMLVMVSSSTGSQQATLIPRTLLYPISVMLPPSLAAAIAFTFNFHNDFTLMTKSIYQRGNIVTRKKY